MNHMFTRGSLVRCPESSYKTPADRPAMFAIVDVETTGFDAEGADRICEIGIVRMHADGTVVREFSTLINPEVHITNSEHHDISDSDVAAAPRFKDVAGILIDLLSNAVVVAHNLEFEERFLHSECERAGIVPPQAVPGLCTLITARAQLSCESHRQPSLAAALLDTPPVVSHHALDDARTCADILAVFLHNAPQPLSWNGKSPHVLSQPLTVGETSTIPPLPRSEAIVDGDIFRPWTPPRTRKWHEHWRPSPLAEEECENNAWQTARLALSAS